MQRRGNVARHPLKGISKAKADEVSAAIGSIDLRSNHDSSAAIALRCRGRRNAVFSSAIALKCPLDTAAIAADCIDSSARVLANASGSCASAVNLHIEVLSHGCDLSSASRGAALRSLRRCFLFADVSVGVIARMCSVAKEMFVAAGSILQPLGSECTSAFIAFDGAFSSNGSGRIASCMLACEESFVLGSMVCRSAVTLLHPSHVAIFPAHCFAQCAALHGQFENSLLSSAAAAFSRYPRPPPAFRVFMHPSHSAVSIIGRAHESIPELPQYDPLLNVLIVVVHGECVATREQSGSFALRAGAVIRTTLSDVVASCLAEVRPLLTFVPLRVVCASSSC